MSRPSHHVPAARSWPPATAMAVSSFGKSSDVRRRSTRFGRRGWFDERFEVALRYWSTEAQPAQDGSVGLLFAPADDAHALDAPGLVRRRQQYFEPLACLHHSTDLNADTPNGQIDPAHRN